MFLDRKIGIFLLLASPEISCFTQFPFVHLYIIDDRENLVDVSHLLPHQLLQVVGLAG